MALQPRDRAKMKHTMATAKRQQPRLVDRTDNQLLHSIKSCHGPEGPRRNYLENSWFRAEYWWR